MDIIVEKVNINPDNVINFEEKAETNFKNYVKYQLLEDFREFQRALISFNVNFVTDKDMPGTTAAVEPEYRLIFINDQIAWCLLNENDPKAQQIFAQRFKNTNLDITDIKPLVSMLIRHELLHCLLDHHRLAVEFYAKLLGYKYETLTDEQYDEVMDEMWRPCLVYRHYNEGKGIPAHNGAGDYHLSISYILKDIEICEKIGGLVLENNSKMVGYGFKKLLAEILKEESKLEKRLYPIVEGRWVAGMFEPIKETPSWFSTATEIAPEDVREIRLMTISNTRNDVNTYKDLLNKYGMNYRISSFATWINDETPPKFELSVPAAKWISYRGDLRSSSIATELPICPILKIENLRDYRKLQEGSLTKCLGCRAVVLPGRREVLLLDPIGETGFNDYSLGKDAWQFERSEVYFFIKDWLKDKLIEYKVRS